MPIAGTALITI